MSLPLVGEIIRPVGSTPYRYCLRVTYARGTRVGGERLALSDDKVPFDDGHRDLTGSSFDLESVSPGVWRSPRHWGGSPRYWVSTLNDQRRQLDLFGRAQ